MASKRGEKASRERKILCMIRCVQNVMEVARCVKLFHSPPYRGSTATDIFVYRFSFLFTVCPETEETLYTDQFFESQDLVVNALDNVEARRYMDR